jgi:tetratricopeptide (TPR) repeat protein
LTSASLQAFSQSQQGAEILKIDSLERLLPSLTKMAHVDCMVLICQHFYAVPPVGKYKFRNDSISNYGRKIFNESTALNYKKGIAEGLLILATDSVKEKNIREAMRIGQEINDDELLGWCFVASIRLIEDRSKNFNKVEDCYKKAIYHFHKAGNLFRELENTVWLADSYLDRGEYESGFDYNKKSNELIKSVSNEFPSVYEDFYYTIAANMSRIYSTAGDYQNAINYLQIANQKFKAANSDYSMSLDIAGLFCDMGKYDSAMRYWVENSRNTDWSSNLPNHIGFTNMVLGDIYLGNKQYDKAIEVYKNCYQTFDTLSETLKKYYYAGFGIMEASLGLAKAEDEKGNYSTALQNAKEGTLIAQQRGLRPFMMKGFEVLSSVYHHLGNNDSAYYYLSKHNIIKDSIQNTQLLLRIYGYKKESEDLKKQSKLMLLDKDNKLKGVQLKQASQQKNFLLIILSALGLAVFFVYRSINLKRKNEKLNNEKIQTELHQRAVELEMQALRAQMNPHFIFNCLSSINRFILKNESKPASGYLVRFSRLIRMVLINSQKHLITLEDELQMLTIYLDMERLRFKDSFDYSITFLNTMETGNIFIPPLLLQPFCENAIWHGLQHLPHRQAGKEVQGRLNIEFSLKDNILHCTISDNGIGLEKSEEMKSKSAEKEKSMGLKITTERLALLNREKGLHSFFNIENILDEKGNVAGTKINLKIGYKEAVEGLI